MLWFGRGVGKHGERGQVYLGVCASARALPAYVVWPSSRAQDFMKTERVVVLQLSQLRLELITKMELDL